MTMAPGFIMDATAKFNAAPTLETSLIRSLTSASDAQGYLRILPTGQLKIGVALSSSVTQSYTTVETIPGAWSAIRHFRATVIRSGMHIIPEYSLDGTRWVTLAEGTFSNTSLNSTTTAPLVIGESSGPLGNAPLILSAALRSLDGTLIAGFTDIGTEWVGTTTQADSTGKTWTLNGDAAIIESVPSSEALITHEFGIAGPRIGYTAEANYLRGMAFGHGGSIPAAHSNGTTETLKRWWRVGDGYESEVMVEHPTSEGFIARPYVPVNPGPAATTYTLMTEYGETYFEYAGDVKLVTD